MYVVHDSGVIYGTNEVWFFRMHDSEVVAKDYRRPKVHPRKKTTPAGN